MKLSKQIIVAGACLGLVACNQTTANTMKPTANIDDEQAFMVAQTALLARLKDPDSAKLTNVRRVGEYICGEVNSKNSFGGYTGPKRFSVSSDGEVLLAGESVEFAVWFTPCFNRLNPSR